MDSFVQAVPGWLWRKDFERLGPIVPFSRLVVTDLIGWHKMHRLREDSHSYAGAGLEHGAALGCTSSEEPDTG
jgi:hypothetical protein